MDPHTQPSTCGADWLTPAIIDDLFFSLDLAQLLEDNQHESCSACQGNTGLLCIEPKVLASYFG